LIKGETHIIVLVAAIFFVAALITTHFLMPFETPLGKAAGDSPLFLIPVHDGYINHNLSNDTYQVNDSSVTLLVGNFTQNDGTSFESRIFFRFDLSSQTDVSNAVLHVKRITGVDNPFPDCPKVYKIPDYANDLVFNENDFTPSSQTLIGEVPCDSDISMPIPSSFLELGQNNAFMITRSYNPDYSNVNMYSSKETSDTKPSLELFFNPDTSPAVPTGLTAVTGSSAGHVALSWTASPDPNVINYVINWWTGASGETIINTGNTTSYDFTTTVSPYVHLSVHNFRIKACSGTGQDYICGDYSNAVTAYPKIGQIDAFGPPDNPSGPYNVAKDTQFTLDGGMQYVPASRTISWAMPNCTPSSSSSLDPVVSCSASTTATLTVTAVNGTGTDSVVVNVSDNTPPVPAITAIAGANPGQVNLSWNETAAGDNYFIKWLIGSALQADIDVGSQEQYTHLTSRPASEPGILHYYSVKACRNSVCSDYSSQVSAYPKVGADAGGPYNAVTDTQFTLNGIQQYAVDPVYISWSMPYCTPSSSNTLNLVVSCPSSTTALLVVNAANGVADNITTITVSDEADIVSPVVSISNPSSGQTVIGTVNFSANASDASGIKNVKFFVDGSLKSTDTISPYEYSWVTTAVSNGSHSLKVVAEDTAGNTAELTITVSVNNVSGPSCGNGVIDSGEDCEVDSDCFSFYDRTQCDYSGKRYGTRTVTCGSSCSCVVGNWTYSSSSYCVSCNSCGDGAQNCGETEASCPEDFGGITDSIPPAKPAGLEATEITKNSITVEWNPNTESDLKRYIIYYEKSPDGVVKEETALKTDSRIIISGLESNSRYFISIVAVDLSGNKSDLSEEISVLTKDDVSVVVPVPTGLNAVVENKSIVLKWSVVVPEPDYYVVQRKVEDGYFEQIGTPENNSFKDSDVEENTKYFYRVAAFLDGKSSNVSEEVEVEFKLETPEDNSITEWGIGSAIIVISLALGYIFFNFDI